MNLSDWNCKVAELMEFHRSIGLLGITARMQFRFRKLLSAIITF